MKTLLGLTTFILLTNLAQAGLKTRVLHIEAPETVDKPYEVLVAKDRNTYTVSAANLELVEKLQKAEESNSVVEIEANENRITSLELIKSGDDLLDFYPEAGTHPMMNYTPSNVESYELAQEMFKGLKKRTKWFSQCYNRAHIWSRQMNLENNVDSMKIFIFYTKKYRREINGKWWFHVAPMIDINGEYHVMDKEFTSKPVTDSAWEYIFTKKMEAKGVYGHRCRVIENIKEYYDESNQKNEYCNILVTSMFYWAPNDMVQLDKAGVQKTKFTNRELRIATKDVFWKSKAIYKKLKVEEVK